MGQTNVALVTFEGLKVPRYVRFYGAELYCYPDRPRQLVCKICHRLGHWADHCPTPHVLICATCGTDNPAPSHPCTPPCRSCDESHPTSDPNCPRRARQTPNKAWVRKALKKEPRELQSPQHIYCFQNMATTGHSQVSTQGTLRARSKSRSRSRRRSQTRSKSRSRSRGASMRPPEKRPPDQTAPPSQQPYKKALLTNASAKVAQAPTETQRISAQKTSTQAPREFLALRQGFPFDVALAPFSSRPSHRLVFGVVLPLAFESPLGCFANMYRCLHSMPSRSSSEALTGRINVVIFVAFSCTTTAAAAAVGTVVIGTVCCRNVIGVPMFKRLLSPTRREDCAGTYASVVGESPAVDDSHESNMDTDAAETAAPMFEDDLP
ncbi:hypothetical protein MRX96_020666 [Rhipicephalus microplus]